MGSTDAFVIIGCGGFGREVYALIEEHNRRFNSLWRCEGFYDDKPSRVDRMRVGDLGSRVLGTVSDLTSSPVNGAGVVIAIGSAAARLAVHTKLRAKGLQYPTLVHPDATVAVHVLLGEGVVIAAGARVSTNVTIGAFAHIDQNATIGHDSEVGSFSRLNPLSCVSGSVEIGSGTLIGANATVLQGLRVGSNATVGASACVVTDVPDNVTVKGVPAR